MLSNKWDKLLIELIDKKVTVTVTKIITGDSWTWFGVIREYVSDEINGGYIIFEHLPTERMRLQTKKTYVHLATYHIGLIDELYDDFDPEITAKCPHCNETLKLEELNVKLDNQEDGEEESHIILLPIDFEMKEEIEKK